MPRLAPPILALALLAGCARPAPPAPAVRALVARAQAAVEDAPVIAAILGNGQTAPTFATWLGRSLTLTAQATSPKGRALAYRWTTDGAFDGRTDGKAVRFQADAWGDFRATVEVRDAAGGVATRTVKIAVWPGAAAE